MLWIDALYKMYYYYYYYFPYDVKLRLLAHSRSFLANQKAGNAIVGAENLLKIIIITEYKYNNNNISNVLLAFLIL